MVYKNLKLRYSIRLLSLMVIILTLLLLLQLNCSNPHSNNVKSDIEKKIKKIGEFTDIFKDPYIVMDDSQIYIWDKFLCKVCIYSKKDLKKITEFGKKGEGPAEFNSVINNVSLTENYIYVSSFPKLICFSKDGKFKKEIRGRTPAGSYMAIGRNFIGRRYIYTGDKSKKDKIAYVLFDPDLRRVKDIFETEFMRKSTKLKNSKIELLWFSGCYKGIVYKDRFYVGTTDRGFFFAVFDSDGNKLYEINKDYKHIRITSEFKETLFNKINKAQHMEGFRRFMAKRKIVFPEYFPAYSDFAVDNDRIYVFKYPTQLPRGAILEVLILDLKGSLIEKKSLPASYWHSFELNANYLFDGKLYFLEMSQMNENLEFYEISL